MHSLPTTGYAFFFLRAITAILLAKTARQCSEGRNFPEKPLDSGVEVLWDVRLGKCVRHASANHLKCVSVPQIQLQQLQLQITQTRREGAVGDDGLKAVAWKHGSRPRSGQHTDTSPVALLSYFLQFFYFFFWHLGFGFWDLGSRVKDSDPTLERDSTWESLGRVGHANQRAIGMWVRRIFVLAKSFWRTLNERTLSIATTKEVAASVKLCSEPQTSLALKSMAIFSVHQLSPRAAANEFLRFEFELPLWFPI